MFTAMKFHFIQNISFFFKCQRRATKESEMLVKDSFYHNIWIDCWRLFSQVLDAAAQASSDVHIQMIYVSLASLYYTSYH